MVCPCSKLDQVSVLASQTNWAWPKAIQELFEPRGVRLIVASGVGQFVDVLRQQRIHAGIVDADTEAGGLSVVRAIRMEYPRLPCLVLSSQLGQDLLDRALQLEVFSVMGKPVDLDLLRKQLNRLFVKTYNSEVFA